jgi:hypothetical protein
MKEAPRDSREAPKVYSDVVDFACGLDRTYFEAHPATSVYVRRYVPGEFWPHDSHVDRELVDLIERSEHAPLLMRVVAMGLGQRLRRPLFDLEALDRLGTVRCRRS